MKNAPDWADTFPRKIYAKIGGKTLTRAVRWEYIRIAGEIYPRDDAPEKVPLIYVGGEPLIICTRDGAPDYLVTLDTLARSFEEVPRP